VRIVAVPVVMRYDFYLLRRMYFVSSRIIEVGRIMCYGNAANLEPRLPSYSNYALQTPATYFIVPVERKDYKQ